MTLMDEETGEILVIRDAFQSRIEVHVRGTSPEDYHVVRLSRVEARRLAALILFQAERLGDARLVAPTEFPGGFGKKIA